MKSKQGTEFGIVGRAQEEPNLIFSRKETTRKDPLAQPGGGGEGGGGGMKGDTRVFLETWTGWVGPDCCPGKEAPSVAPIAYLLNDFSRP